MHAVRIQASNLAAAVGLNPYKKQTEIIEALWRKRNPASFKLAFETARVKDVKTIRAEDMRASPVAASLTRKALQVANSAKSAEEIFQTGSALRKVVQDSVDECVQKKDALEKLIASGGSRPGLEEDLKQVTDEAARLQTANLNVQSEIQKTLYTTFGTKREVDAISAYEKQTGLNVTRLKSFNSLEIADTDANNPNVIITGGVDGLLGDDCILEVKNRTRRLFHKVPMYERVQVEAYMRIFDKSRAVLLEFLLQQAPESPPVFDVHEVLRDDNLWLNTIVPRLFAIDRLLKAVCEDDEQAKDYASKSLQSREEYVRSLTIAQQPNDTF